MNPRRKSAERRANSQITAAQPVRQAEFFIALSNQVYSTCCGILYATEQPVILFQARFMVYVKLSKIICKIILLYYVCPGL